VVQYDYVIIGGGSPGAVLASRLSENEDRSVLLLKTGIDEASLCRGFFLLYGVCFWTEISKRSRHPIIASQCIVIINVDDHVASKYLNGKR